MNSDWNKIQFWNILLYFIQYNIGIIYKCIKIFCSNIETPRRLYYVAKQNILELECCGRTYYVFHFLKSLTQIAWQIAWSKTPYIRRLAPIKIWLALLQSLSEQKELNLDFISRYSIGFILFILGKFCICTSSYLALK